MQDPSEVTTRRIPDSVVIVLVCLTWYSLLSGLVLALGRSILLQFEFSRPASTMADIGISGTLIAIPAIAMPLIRTTSSSKWAARVFPVVLMFWLLGTGITWWNCLYLPVLGCSHIAVDALAVSMVYVAAVFSSGLAASGSLPVLLKLVCHWKNS